MVAAASAWGMSGIFVTLILENSNGTSVSLAFWRDLAAFITFFLFTFFTQRENLKIRKNDLSWLAAMGVFLGGFHILYNMSVMYNGAAVTTVLQAAMPAIVTITAFYLWKEELTPDKIGSMVIIFAGTVMSSGINIYSIEQADMAGLAAGFGVPVLYAGWSLCGKSMVTRYGASACLTVAFGTASVILLPFQPFTAQPFPLNLTIIVLFCAFIAISTFGAFTLYLMGMKYIQAGTASILVMSEILFAGVYAWFLLGERVTTFQALGAMFVISGVVWLSIRQ